MVKQSPDSGQIKQLVLELLIEHGEGDEEALRSARDVNLAADVAVDSLHMVEIVLEIEEALGLDIPDRDLTSKRLRSVSRFTEYLVERLKASSQPT